MKSIRGRGVRRSVDSAVLSEKAIKSAIAWASDEKRLPPYVERQEDILLATDRLRFEIDYLKAIAAFASLVAP